MRRLLWVTFLLSFCASAVFSDEPIRILSGDVCRDGFSVAFDRRDNLYVSQAGVGNVYKLRPNGTHVYYTTGLGSALGIVVDSDTDYLYVANGQSKANCVMVFFTNDGRERYAYSFACQNILAYDVATSPLWYVYVVNSAGSVIEYFSKSGPYSGTWNLGLGFTSITVDSNGYVYAVGQYNIIKYGPTGGRVAVLNKPFGYETPFGIHIDVNLLKDNAIYVNDNNDDRLVQMDLTGTIIGAYTNVTNRTALIRRTAIQPSTGNVYILTDRSRIFVFEPHRSFVPSTGASGITISDQGLSSAVVAGITVGTIILLCAVMAVCFMSFIARNRRNVMNASLTEQFIALESE